MHFFGFYKSLKIVKVRKHSIKVMMTFPPKIIYLLIFVVVLNHYLIAHNED